MTKERIEFICNQVRYHLSEAISDANFVPPELSSFPGGACELTSYWLGTYLKEIGFKKIIFCNGSRQLAHEEQPKNHVWLHIDDRFYVDITGDQFDNCSFPVVVEETIPDYLRDFNPIRTYPIEKADAVCLHDCNYNNIWKDLNQRLKSA